MADNQTTARMDWTIGQPFTPPYFWLGADARGWWDEVLTPSPDGGLVIELPKELKYV